MPVEVTSVLLAGIAAAGISYLVCRLMTAAPILDAPDGVRKLQERPVPSAGGVGLIAGLALSVAGFVLWHDLTLSSEAIVLAIGAALAFLLGLLDDTRELGAKSKLAGQAAIAIAMAAAGLRVEMFDLGSRVFELPMIVALSGSALWILVVMNAVNFMDGANGVAMGPSAVMALSLAGLAALTGAGQLAVLFLLLAASLAGFLVLNLQGRLYAGDGGALFVGTMLAGGSLFWLNATPVSVWLPPLVLLPFLADVFLTLIWRASQRRSLFEAHRDHIYQIALKAGLKHHHVASIYALFALHTGLAAAGVLVVGGRAPQIAFVLGVVVFFWMFRRVRLAYAASGLNDPQ